MQKSRPAERLEMLQQTIARSSIHALLCTDQETTTNRPSFFVRLSSVSASIYTARSTEYGSAAVESPHRYLSELLELFVDHVLVAQLAIEANPSRVHVCVVTQRVGRGFATSDLQHTDAIELMHLRRRPDVLVLNLRQSKLQTARLTVSITIVFVGTIALQQGHMIATCPSSLSPHAKTDDTWLLSPI